MSNENLRQALRDADLDVYELASLVRVDVKSVQRWISSGRTPYPRHRTRVSRALGVPEEQLWPDTTPVRRQPPAQDPGQTDEPAGDETTDTDLPSGSDAPTPTEAEAEVEGDDWDLRLASYGNVDWYEIINTATKQIDLLDYTLAEMLNDPRLVDTLLRKGAAGVKIRILITGSLDPFLADAEIERQLEPGTLLHRFNVPDLQQPIAKQARNSEQTLWDIRDEPGIRVRQFRAHRYNTIIRGDGRMLILLHTWGTPTAEAMMMYTTADQDDTGVYDRFTKHFQDIWDHAVPLDEPMRWEDLEDWEQELDRISQPNHRVYQLKLNEARDEYYRNLHDDRTAYNEALQEIIENYRRRRDEEQPGQDWQ